MSKNLREINPIQAIEISQKLIELLIKGFENIGFRKKTNERVKVLEETVIMLHKRILELENK